MWTVDRGFQHYVRWFTPSHSRHACLCQDTASLFTLRGLCPSSSLDTVYKLKPALLNGRRQFSGPTGWLLHWKGAQWAIQNPRRANCFDTKCEVTSPRLQAASAVGSTHGYPVGTSYWTVEADGCFTAGLVLLTLTACSDSQFTCDSGHCVRWVEKWKNKRTNRI